ncbi:choline BCCT transporter BetT [Gilvimarinus agarilyticus]|uniref:BCCT family transporter n=1 Tax=unclassified Gilvimarinus TaxID=2642066 RepID=UPI001C090D9A|nr:MULTISPECIES: choline BCCT transporter BetT [unclassified Gilvimarinus]MBU2886874.1 choline BCCT transporter BetT [Gilvimarinus agarilyticus]MDO6571535.1 choline BCCT transporter BetT [Gilvimarinus sp. 2_MG-2023]MDO6747942.1 choline BCCT transporter BetT [Gilvimarinus sp. 1_MG-2023]
MSDANANNQEQGSKINIKVNPPVFFGAGGLCLLFVLYAVIWPAHAEVVFSAMQGWVVHSAGWFYVLAVALFFIFVVVLALSDYGRIKLGPDHSEPDYSYFSWFAMLFSAGMGIGLMFFGVAEPVMHTMTPPVGDPATADAAREAMKITFFHWGVHAWAIYAVVALSLAYFAFRHNLPLTIRSAFYPLIGERIYGPIGHAVDIFAVLGTLFGVATSLGLGVMQVNAGLNYLFDVEISTGVQIALIAGITLLATVSVVLGLDGGIRRVSELNLFLAVALLLFVLIAGPTVHLLQTYVQNVGYYLSGLVETTFNLYAYEPTGWIGGWTLFYWGWWIAWSPFVGMFIARVSRGRSIREFVVGVLMVPVGFTFMWMTFFGNTAVNMILEQGITQLADAVAADSSVALFQFFEYLPMTTIASLVATVLVITFFVTSSDSGSLVVDMLTSGGTEEDTPVWQRIFWSVSEGVIAASLLVAGGLAALQTATIASALPFTVVMLLMCWGLFKALRLEIVKRVSLRDAMLAPRVAKNPVTWQNRLARIVHQPKRDDVLTFLQGAVHSALRKVADELHSQGLMAKVEQDEQDRLWLEVNHGEETDFFYSVHVRPYTPPTFVMRDTSKKRGETLRYYRAEVYLKEGGQDYDVMGWSEEQVIADVLDQYEKHMHFLNAVR